MPKLEVKSTSIVVNNYTIGDIPQLEKCFRIWNPTKHRYEYHEILYYNEEKKQLYLPRGMDISLIERLVGHKAVIANTYSINNYQIYKDIKLKYPPKNDVQKEALRFMVGLKPYQATQDRTQLILNLTTGKGKTYISIATIAYTGIKSIVITSSVEWLNQWRERIIYFSNIKDREIYTISGGSSIRYLLNNNNNKIDKTKIFLVTHDTIRNYAEENGWESIRDFFSSIKVGYKFFDEAHLDFKNIMMIDYFSDVYKTFYITASFGRSSTDENRIYQMSFKKVLSIELYNKQEDAHTKYVALLFKSGANAGEVSSCKGRYGLDRNKYINYLIRKNNYYKLLALLLEIILPKLQNDKKALFYIGINDAIKETYEWLNYHYPDLRGNIGIFSMASDNKQLAKTKKIILSTTKSAGACMDIAGLKVTVLLNEPFKSEILAQQTLGRTRDRDTIYIECVDTDFYYCKKYYYAKRPVYVKYATDCTEIKVSQEELDDAYNNLVKPIYVNPTPRYIAYTPPYKKYEENEYPPLPYKKYKDGENPPLPYRRV